jgi:hypothetical protein
MKRNLRESQMRQPNMVEGFIRWYSQVEEEKTFERLNQLLEKLEMVAQDLVEIKKALKALALAPKQR